MTDKNERLQDPLGALRKTTVAVMEDVVVELLMLAKRNESITTQAQLEDWTQDFNFTRFRVLSALDSILISKFSDKLVDEMIASEETDEAEKVEEPEDENSIDEEDFPEGGCLVGEPSDNASHQCSDCTLKSTCTISVAPQLIVKYCTYHTVEGVSDDEQN